MILSAVCFFILVSIVVCGLQSAELTEADNLIIDRCADRLSELGKRFQPPRPRPLY